MPDTPVPAPDSPAGTEASVPAPRASTEPVLPASATPSAGPEKLPADGSPPPHGVPWWFWPVSFLVVFGVDAALVLALVSLGQNLAIAAGVPGALTLVALSVLRAIAGHIGRRDD